MGASFEKGMHTNRGGTPHGNKNAIGNDGGAPEKNSNSVTHGFFRKFLPDDTIAIMEEIETRSPLDMMWDQITIQYAAILRAQQIMYVKDKDEMIKEGSKSKQSLYKYEIKDVSISPSTVSFDSIPEIQASSVQVIENNSSVPQSQTFAFNEKTTDTFTTSVTHGLKTSLGIKSTTKFSASVFLISIEQTIEVAGKIDVPVDLQATIVGDPKAAIAGALYRPGALYLYIIHCLKNHPLLTFGVRMLFIFGIFLLYPLHTRR
jgi:hypothetical protein